ncbi:MAG: response regulator [Stellaceae bacterium]|jgi:FixJ family two-component response regulator
MSDKFIVMIVDDDDSIRRAARRLIKSYGFPVETFVSAEDFLASGRLHATACLVLDVQMPGLNGLELQSRLIADGYRIPIIFITAFHDENTQAQTLKTGALAYLVKPFEEADLLSAINIALQRQEGVPRSPGALQ